MSLRKCILDRGIEQLKNIGVDLVYEGFHNVYSGKLDVRTLEQKISWIEGYTETVIYSLR